MVFIKKSERSKPIKIPGLKTFYGQFPSVFSENEEIDAKRSTHQDTNFLIDSNFDFNDDDDNAGVIYCFRTGCSRFVPG